MTAIIARGTTLVVAGLDRVLAVIDVRFDTSGPLDMRATFSKLVQSKNDPTATWRGNTLWRATNTPDGPATTAVDHDGTDLRLRAWGVGAQAAASLGQELCGAHHGDGFDHPLIHNLRRRWPGMRTPRTGAVFEAVVFSTLAQRVTSLEAVQAWRHLVKDINSPAPLADANDSPTLLMPPTPKDVLARPSWRWHRWGVEVKRAQAIRSAARCEKRLEESLRLEPDEARQRIAAIPGLGIWTAGEVAGVALGDDDALSVGDFHLANWVGWALARQPRSTDTEMLEMLAPFAGRRGLVAKLIMRAGDRPPAFGPRYTPLPIAAL